MRNPELFREAAKARVEAEQAQMTERIALAKNVEQKELRSAIAPKEAIDPDVKKLIVASIRGAQEKQMSLTQWTAQILENARGMTKEQQTEVLELTAKVTARQGIPTSEKPILFGEGQIEASV